MPLTQVRGGQVQDGSIQRVDLDVSTAGQAVIRKVIQGNGISIGYDGVDSGTGDVTVNLAAVAANSIMGNATGAPQPPVPITNWANPAWLSSLAWSKLTGVPSFEPALGNPAANGYILSSTTAGARSWIAPPAGGGTITLTGDITGSGTTSIATQIAANAVTAAEIAANTIGASEMNNTQDMLMAAAQSIRVADAGNNVLNVLRIAHNYTGTPTANAEGVALSFEGKSDTTVDRTLGQIKCQWSTVADATRTSWMDLGTVLNGTLSTAMRLFGSNGVSVNNTTDPGAGFINVPTAGGYKINNTNIFGPSMGSMANGDVLRAIGTGTFDSFTPNSYTGTPANPTGRNSTVGVMAGLGSLFKLTPAYSGRVFVIVAGRLGTNTAGVWAMCGISYGTGTAPANGAASTGTTVGANAISLSVGSAASATVPFTCQAVITGLTKGTAYWFDLWFGNSASATANLYDLTVTAIEL